jgi:hypothetical protein
MSDQPFRDLCINTKFSNPFEDDGYRWCRLESTDDYVECAYSGKWNECPKYKSVRQAMRELK